MALKKKWSAIEKANADIYVVLECSQSDILKLGAEPGYQSFWAGSNKNKGLGIVAKEPYRIKKFSETGFEWIGAAEIEGPQVFTIYPVWACISKQVRDMRYIRQIHAFIDKQESGIASGDSIIIGDFNSNSIWDSEHGDRSHSKAVEKLAKLGLKSAYHSNRQCPQGQEIEPTIYFRKNRSLAYHIDYCFASENILKKLRSIEIGKHDDWISLSDHMPLSADFNFG